MKSLIKKILIRIVNPVIKECLKDEFDSVRYQISSIKNLMKPDYDDEFEKYMSELRDIRIEATNHCQYHCSMCPHDKMVRPKGFMSIENLNLALINVSSYRPDFSGIVQLHDFGEALLDKALPEKIKIVRKNLPLSYIRFLSTVGYAMPDGIFEDMVQNGLNLLMISCYGIDKHSYKQIHGIDRYELVMTNMRELSRLVKKYSKDFSVLVAGCFLNDSGEGVHVPINAINEFRQRIIDFGFSYNDSKLHNFGGQMNFNPTMYPVKPCGVYKKYLSHVLNINWDMKIVPCCMVSDQDIVFGDLSEKPLREIYFDKIWGEFREAHKKMKLRETFPFCWKCHHDSNIWMRDND
jgi:MoaA/NifB/PqqE/SkfB family radical SAM enzyme